MSKSASCLKSALLVATAMCVPHHVMAQDDSAAAAADNAAAGKNSIIVTARKVEERLIDVPLQISVFTDENIEQQDIRDLADIAQSTPGLEYEPYPNGGLSSAPVIRGMSQTFTVSRVQNTATFVDGIYMQRQSMVNPGLFDVERVEVVKGPQSAVYGRNAFSGAINYVTKKPGDDWEASVGGTVGIYDRYDYNAAISAPVIPGIFAVRGQYSHSESDGHTKNFHPFAENAPTTGHATRGRLGGWEDESYSIAARLTPGAGITADFLYYNYSSAQESGAFFNIFGPRRRTVDESWTPADNKTNCVNSTTIYRLQTGATTFVNIPIIGPHAYCGELPTHPLGDAALSAAGYDGTQIMVDPRSNASIADSELITGTLAWEVSDRISVKYQFGRIEHSADALGSQTDRDSVIGGLITEPLPPFLGPKSYRYTTFNANPVVNLTAVSHEGRIDYSGDKFEIGAGVYFSNTKDDKITRFNFPAPCNSAAICSVGLETAPAAAPGNISVVTGPPPAPTINVPFFPFLGHGADGNEDFHDDDIMAFFGSVKVHLSDTLNITAEARYEEEDKTYRQASSTFGFPASYSDSISDSFFTPRVTVQWRPDWADGGQFYALVAKGVKTGGFNSVNLAVNPNQATYAEETNWTYEVGAKLSLFDDLLAFNIGAYYIDWKNVQGIEAADSPDPFAVDVTGNIGDARVYGVEMDGLLQVADPFSIDFSLTLLDPKYRNGIYSSARTVNADGTPNLTSTWGCTDATPECDKTGDITGKQLERTSTVQGSLGFNFAQPISKTLDLTARLGLTYRNKMYVSPLNLAHNGDRVLANANIGIEHDNFTISFWGKNIFNKKYVANSFLLQSFNNYIVGRGAERTIGVTVKAGF